jgi:PAS domain S-box-containing protein
MSPEPRLRRSKKAPSAAERRLRVEVSGLRARLLDADETVRAIRAGEVDALVLHGSTGEQIFTLKGAESSYRLLVETMSEGAVTFSENGTILYCNGCFATMVGRPLERAMGAQIHDFIAPEDCETFRALVLQGVQRGAKNEISLAGPHGLSVPVYVSLSPLRGEEGARLVCLVATDLSAQKRSAEMLASGRLATSVIEQATDAILVCDQEGRIIRASTGALAFTGSSPLFLRFGDAFPCEALQIVAAAALTGQKSQGVAASLGSANGARIEVLANGAPLLGTSGGIVGAIVTITDVTDLRKTQRELEGAVKVRDEFLSIASHELRTPLTALQLQLQSLLRLAKGGVDSLFDPRWEKKLQTALRQTQRLTKLTGALLDVARLTTGRLRLDLEEFDLSSAVREVVARSSDDAMTVGCELRFHQDAPSVGFWDGVRIEQALVNLISNAMKFGPGKPVDITVDSGENDVFITVEDRGSGIDAKDTERIFQLFERAVSNTNYGGLGLGLFITRQIVEACGGSIDVASEVGRGSVFRISLPVRKLAPLPEVDPSGTALAPPWPRVGAPLTLPRA